VSEAPCPKCGAPISGEAGFGMVLCGSCGELVMIGGQSAPPNLSSDPEAASEPVPESAPEVFRDVVEFGNQDQPSAGFGSLVYDIEIQGIDTAEIREEVSSHLTDSRLQLDVSAIMASVEKGVMRLSAINPVKASVILNRLRHLPLKIKWNSHQMIKDSVPLLAFLFILSALFFGGANGLADDWQKHDANLRSYVTRINADEDDLKDLIEKKDHNTDPAIRDKLLDDIKKKDAEIKDLFERFREEKEHIIYEHPEQGDNTERKYKHVKPKTAAEIESETGIDGKLSRLKSKIEKTYPEAVPASTAVPKN
jgi:hypothetical protein